MNPLSKSFQFFQHELIIHQSGICVEHQMCKMPEGILLGSAQDVLSQLRAEKSTCKGSLFWVPLEYICRWLAAA